MLDWREVVGGHECAAGVALAAAGVVAGRVTGELAGVDVPSVEREEADERLERVAVGELADGRGEVEAVRAGERDELALIGDERHARHRARGRDLAPWVVASSGSGSRV